MIDDSEIIAALDVVWLTVPAIHKRLGYEGLAHELSGTLQRLAAAGKIEVNTRPTLARFYRKGGESTSRHYSIHCYRRAEAATVDTIECS